MIRYNEDGSRDGRSLYGIYLVTDVGKVRQCGADTQEEAEEAVRVLREQFPASDFVIE